MLTPRILPSYSEVLNSAPQVLPTPDLNAIARSSDRFELCKLCRLAVGLAVQSAANDVHIAAIQTLAQGDQHQLMMAIEQVIGTLNAAKPSEEEREADVSAVRDLDDEAYYASRTRGGSDAALEAARAEKETLEKVYMQLLEEHRTLQTAHEDMRAEKDDAVRDLAQVRAKADDAREAHMDVLMRQDIERLKGELRRSEDNLAEAESEVERLGNVMGEMTRKVSASAPQKAPLWAALSKKRLFSSFAVTHRRLKTCSAKLMKVRDSRIKWTSTSMRPTNCSGRKT